MDAMTSISDMLKTSSRLVIEFLADFFRKDEKGFNAVIILEDK